MIEPAEYAASNVKPHRKWLGMALWVFGATIVSIGLLAGAAIFMAVPELGTSFTTEQVSPEQLKQCAAAMGMTFPESTRAVGLDFTEWQDTFIWLKVEMKRDDLQAFIDNSPLANVELDDQRIGVGNNDRLKWWNVEELRAFEHVPKQSAFRSAEVEPPGEWLRVLIDLRDETKAIVYIEWCDM